MVRPPNVLVVSIRSQRADSCGLRRVADANPACKVSGCMPSVSEKIDHGLLDNWLTGVSPDPSGKAMVGSSLSSED
jgi:hypothetical protein